MLDQYLQNAFACLALYLTAGSFFYARYSNKCSTETVKTQIIHSVSAIPVYALLPTASDWFIQNGWTRAYTNAPSVFLYFAHVALYLTSVELGVYVMHRFLHENKFLYKHLHSAHHKYRTVSTLSPFASLAFHPVDGMLQGLPYFLTLFLVPIHVWTFKILLFSSGLWSCYIHSVTSNPHWLILGAGHHTIHHTHFKYNYGHYTTIFDRLLKTLQSPVIIPPPSPPPVRAP